MGTQHYRSLRVYAELTPPAAFDAADEQSYVPFKDPAASDPAVAPLTQSQGIAIKVDSGTVEWSFTGVEAQEGPPLVPAEVHGKLSAADGMVRFFGVREREIFFRQSGGAATVRFWAW